MENLRIKKVVKNVYLRRKGKKFDYQYDIVFGKLDLNDFFYKETSENVVLKEAKADKSVKKYEFKELKDLSNEEKDEFKELNLDKLGGILIEILHGCFIKYENKVSLWKPSEKYLITESINLNEFKDDPNSNIPLKNIFSLSNYLKGDIIKTKIEEAERNNRSLRRLEKQLSRNTTKYVNDVWKGHKIKFDIRITDQMTCQVHIKDRGKKNEDNYYAMISRSQGFKQFISLILTLSIENEKFDMKDRLILVDEPENHLHPSGVRNMRNELIKMGIKNYVFISTHSNFIIDNKKPERNIIIKKDSNNNTYKKEIKSYDDLVDDEVLKEAFGINVYKDFLTPNKILVEGLSDKLILKKAIRKSFPDFDFAITNGKGSNLPVVASLLNYEDIDPLVVLDDDKQGKENKKNILKVNGIFTTSNVFTIRDLVGEIINDGTIEDLLPREFVISKFKEIYKKHIKEDFNSKINEKIPIIEELKRFLINKLGRDKKKEIHEFLEKLKIRLSEDYDPSNIKEKAPLLYSLSEKLVERLKK